MALRHICLSVFRTSFQRAKDLPAIKLLSPKRLGTLVANPLAAGHQQRWYSHSVYTGGGYPTIAGRKRVCFQMRFSPVDLDQYIDDHKTVWPKMQTALRECGWHNYSLYCRPDGFALGYFETENKGFDEACDLMSKTDINPTWQDHMAKYTPTSVRPIDSAQELTHYFYLGDDVIEESIRAKDDPRDADWSPQTCTGPHKTQESLNRICFQMQFKADKLDSYLQRHKSIWPEMQTALKECGWHNYSLFYREDGFACGFFETDAENFAEACSRMESYPVNHEWQKEMSVYTVDTASPTDAAQQLKHYFYLGVDKPE